ncbi:MAG TPA: methylenetetrahydrofolate reductase [NAD(P)H] [Bacillota bacterium]|jgi:methylenetetrahydrofolate reductase (NADPH)|uniref:methylenetetrahydrofolate reductase [NAD(P)H] n=1 Tax=Acetivibrio sp. TaxID=1872092 RepID=UPI002C0D454B|nr:methylenetetrahydrofolate reductase [NAD(P)H] [Acetivibrio sp.]HOM03729.1 methylenetetrahydrofolate reductase [NAD(P)H] [Acetivibrio sp.]HPO96756.1 methylenetetrahydrofolate reductase [NAD(P)H] [Bacillota bacterium]
MKICELYQMKRVFSFEVFPPRRTDTVNTIYDTIKKLKALNPDFISVTYGAGGSESNTDTFKIASAIKNNYGIESVAHFPCINLTKGEVLKMLEDLRSAGIENILALRGDVNPGFNPKNDFKFANDLISFIKEHGDFNIIAACYPEGHFESPTIIEDIRNLKRKVDAGANQLITQLFFDNNYFYSFRERAAIAGINVPIEAGIMPVVNKKQIERIVAICRVNLPKKFLAIMNRYENNPQALRDAGIAYAVDQIIDLIAQGVDGIHLYTMNNPYIAQRIYEAINTLLVA